MKSKDILSKEELLRRLKKCGQNSDNEGAHVDADELLLQYINDENITTVWNEISKRFWYA